MTDRNASRLDWGRKGFFAELGADVLSLLIYGPIGAGSDENENGVRSVDVVQKLQDFQGRTIEVYINSPGGVVAEALAIYHALLRHPARKVVQIDGLCASAATIIAMAGDRISASEGTMLMVHPPLEAVNGGADFLRREADVLDKLNETVVNLYVQRTGRSRDEVARWVSDETWFTAQEALAVGLIDEVNAARRAVASWDFARYGLSRPTERTDGAGAVAELRREVRELKAQVAQLRAAGGNAEASAVMAGLGETFHEWIADFKDAVLDALQSDPALQDGAESFRELTRELHNDGNEPDDVPSGDELSGASATGETEYARLLARVKRGPRT